MGRVLAFIALTLVAGIPSSSCSGGGGGGGRSTPPVQGQVGPDGGTLTFANGVKLTFPPGAVAAPTVVSVHDLAAEEIDAILSDPALSSTRARRFLGGFSAEPDGLVFQAPVRASIPVSPLRPYEIPVPITVRLGERTYRYDSGEIVYDGTAGTVELELRHFSDVELGGLSGQEFEDWCTACETFEDPICEEFDALQPACCLIPRAMRASCPAAAKCECCREKQIRVVSNAVDIQGGDCVLLSDDVQITFLDCPGSPTEFSSLSDISHKDLKLEISLDPTAMDLPVKEVDRFSATVTCRRGTTTIFTNLEVEPIWTSAAPEVASFVDLLGSVRGNMTSPWPVTVRASLGASSGVDAAADVSVFCPGCTVAIQAPRPRLSVGETVPLTAVVRDGQGEVVEVSPETLTWTSSDPAVAALMQIAGVDVTLLAVAEGTTTVTASYQDVKERASAQLDITVGSSVDIDVYLSRQGSKVLCPGRTVELVPEVVDGNTGLPYGGCAVEWSSSDPLIASVDQGHVTAHSPGRADIRASCGGASRTADIKVVQNDPSTGSLGHRCFLVTVTDMVLSTNNPGESCALVASQGTAPVSGRSLGMTGYGGDYRVVRPPNAASPAEEGYAIFDVDGLHDMFTESYNPYYPDDYTHSYNIRRNWIAGAGSCELTGYYDWDFYGPVDSCAGRNSVTLTPVDFIIEGGDPFPFCE